MENKIVFQNVSKEYRKFHLGELSFAVPKGYVTGLIGNNGAGKTTIMKGVLSLISVNGEIFVDGASTKNLDYLQDVGFVMEESFLGKDWSLSLVNRIMKAGYTKWEEDTYFRYLERFHLEKKTKVKELSRGMKMKLMLSIALSHQANLLILDEPTSGLDPAMREEFVKIIQEFLEEEDHTVIFSTHITQDLEAIADFMIYIHQGKLLQACTKEEFLNKYRILKGSSQELSDIPDSAVLGRKTTLLYEELLVEQEILKGKEERGELPTIEQIMTLMGRGK